MVTTKDMQRGARSSIVAICLVLGENMHDLHICEGLRGWKKPKIQSFLFFKALVGKVDNRYVFYKVL